MRKTLTTSGAALSLMLVLTGCSGPGVDSVELSNDPDPGTAPSVTFETPLNVEEDQAKVLREGDGADIEEGDFLFMQGAVFQGSDGASIWDTYSQGGGNVFQMGDQLKEQAPEMHAALSGAKEGAIIAYSSPRTAGQAGDDSTSVEVFEIVRRIPTEIEGEMRDSPRDLPEVTQDDEGVPTVAKPEGKAPGKLVSEYLIEGDGEEVGEDDTVIAHYVGVKWSDGETFDSSYEKGAPASFPLDNVIEGWQKGLAGKKAGSRVILSVPVDQAYGTEEELEDQPNYPAGSLLFVVDILAVVDTPEAPAAPEPSASATGAGSSASPSATEE